MSSSEFLFLLQRMDRLDEKLTAEIRALGDRLTTDMKALDGKLTAEMKALDGKVTSELKHQDDKLSSIRFWAIGSVITMAAGFVGVIVALVR